jgi:hypothetical protein
MIRDFRTVSGHPKEGCAYPAAEMRRLAKLADGDAHGILQQISGPARAQTDTGRISNNPAANMSPLSSSTRIILFHLSGKSTDRCWTTLVMLTTNWQRVDLKGH